jgi:hypothetical protein
MEFLTVMLLHFSKINKLFTPIGSEQPEMGRINVITKR